MGPIGIPELIIFSPFLVGTILALWAFGRLASRVRKQAQRFGYPSIRAYLRAAPQSDDERKDAVDLALKGLVLCLLGMLFSPVVLFGLVPLFYGGRKLVYSSMGLGLVDDGEQPRA